MATNEVTLKVPQGINVGNLDANLVVHQDGKLLGRLELSRGGVDWIPSNSRSRYVLRWSVFSQVMQDHGRKRDKR
jgi:hypothetical protein